MEVFRYQSAKFSAGWNSYGNVTKGSRSKPNAGGIPRTMLKVIYVSMGVKKTLYFLIVLPFVTYRHGDLNKYKGL